MKRTKKPTNSSTAETVSPEDTLIITFKKKEFTIQWNGTFHPGDVLLALERAKDELLSWD